MLKLKIPPPLVGITLGVAVLLVNHFLPAFRIDALAFKAVAYLLVAIGISIELWSVGLFVKARTTVNPLKPDNSKQLVRSGMYRFTRNPMYLGMLLLLLGLVFWLGSPLGLAMPVLFVWFITKFQIRPEEEALTRLFGGDFIDYKSAVRRWI